LPPLDPCMAALPLPPPPWAGARSGACAAIRFEQFARSAAREARADGAGRFGRVWANRRTDPEQVAAGGDKIGAVVADFSGQRQGDARLSYSLRLCVALCNWSFAYFVADVTRFSFIYPHLFIHVPIHWLLAAWFGQRGARVENRKSALSHLSHAPVSTVQEHVCASPARRSLPFYSRILSLARALRYSQQRRGVPRASHRQGARAASPAHRLRDRSALAHGGGG
jgi:hypothetical protein